MKFCKGLSDRDLAEDFVIRKHQGHSRKRYSNFEFNGGFWQNL